MPAADSVHEMSSVLRRHGGLRSREDVEADVVPDLVQAWRRLFDVNVFQERQVVDAWD